MAKTKPARRGAAKSARKTGSAKSARPAAKGAKSAGGARRAATAKAAGGARTSGAAKGGGGKAKAARSAKAAGSAKTARRGATSGGAGKAKTTTTASTARPAKIRTRTVTGAVSRRAPTLDRARRRMDEDEDIVPTPPSSLDLDRSASAARTGRAELRDRLNEHTSTGPELTGGDVDADWEAAEATGDEAPGGDNMTPDQDVVDEIGKALGVEYDDDEELRGGEEIVERDKKRWELDPASKEDFDEPDE
jgi:hypothetical protein